ncbi:preprotein translocase subunit SecE [Pseudonocardia asaccharolytica]|uniref:Protein translocase subunit SecE n=1 Tax=Pseudonocardia asaccharolytica DSM 44247 = NBRC 16224 TaxID=1123024 RepID=A0A511CUQ1_9PSEU|nr:preprotein translocase subunit SecE [Pseudonocardia asaccharolytica]GEL16305.1 protein translocase subunit SecE [Pseudonocardia asaccharolytica DSM 44247 = NBRC 16224]
MSDERESGRSGQERPSTAADRRGRHVAPVPAAGGGASKGRPTPVRDGRPAKGSLPNRIMRFLREVVAELRKVIWPTRREMVTYTIVVLIFVSFMVALVALMDFVFGQGVLFLFGT